MNVSIPLILSRGQVIIAILLVCAATAFATNVTNTSNGTTAINATNTTHAVNATNTNSTATKNATSTTNSSMNVSTVNASKNVTVQPVVKEVKTKPATASPPVAEVPVAATDDPSNLLVTILINLAAVALGAAIVLRTIRAKD